MKMLPSGFRPDSFEIAAQWVNAGAYSFGDALAELIDESKKMDKCRLASAMTVEPVKLETTNADYGNWQDAYLAAAAEHLAWGAGIDIPRWTDNPDRFLSKPWYDNHGYASLNALVFAESPPAFRRRCIFTEANPLRRA